MIEIKKLTGLIEGKDAIPAAAGIDLTGSEKKKSGVCILNKEKARFFRIKTNEEIIKRIAEENPAVISIDAPLSLPAGRCCTRDACSCRKYGINRECERILRKRRIRAYPCLIKSMQSLTRRGIKLARIFRQSGFCVIESFPGAAQDILGFPRKKADFEGLKTGLFGLGISTDSDRNSLTHDEIDALTSALTGYFYLAGRCESLGNDEEGYLIIPKLNDS